MKTSKMRIMWILILIIVIGLPSAVYGKGFMDGGSNQKNSEEKLLDSPGGTDSEKNGGFRGFLSGLFGLNSDKEKVSNNNSAANNSKNSGDNDNDNSGGWLTGLLGKIFKGGGDKETVFDDDEDIMGILSSLFDIGAITPPPAQAPSGNSAGTTAGSGNYTVENTGGKLTYSLGGIPSKYNGKYIIAVAYTESGESLFACAGVNSRNETITGAQISNGGATLQVWRTSDTGSLLNFNGRGNYFLMTCIMNQGVTAKADWDRAIENPLSNGLFSAADVMGSVSFSSGTGTASTGMFMDTFN